ncbi:MAG: hypothetical protein IPK82_10795 [Polyangiaceae bacterium]|nr:hypothetical protein [Polyangiaceae bacterium]
MRLIQWLSGLVPAPQMYLRASAGLVFTACAVAACTLPNGSRGGDELDVEEAQQAIDVENPTGAGLTFVVRPGQWSTTDGSWVDQRCVAGETAVATAGGGQVCVIGTHGGVGEIQCMPPPGVFAGSGANQLVCSVCYAGTPTTLSGEQGVAQVLGVQQGVPCQDVIACTGPVSPMGVQPTPLGGGTCATMQCAGVWVNGCSPPQAISPNVPGICFTTTNPPSYPNPTLVTVGCFAGDLPHNIWQRCRDRYANHVTSSGLFGSTTCADEWASADPSSPGFQSCQALVRTCIQNTQAACAAAAPLAAPPAPVAAPLQCVHCVAGQAPLCKAAVAVDGGMVEAAAEEGACVGDLPFLIAGVCPATGDGWSDAAPNGCDPRAANAPPPVAPPGGCAFGLTDCGGVCVDLTSDSTNCGACAAACALGDVCLGGICTAPGGGTGGGGTGGGGAGAGGPSSSGTAGAPPAGAGGMGGY